MHIGPYRIDNPLALAPMVGVTDKFFRRLCRDLGAGYVVSEMLAADPALRDAHVSRPPRTSSIRPALAEISC